MSSSFVFEVRASSGLEANEAELDRVRSYTTSLLCELLSEDAFAELRGAVHAPDTLVLTALAAETTGAGLHRRSRLVVRVEAPREGLSTAQLHARRGVELLVRALHADRSEGSGYRAGWDWVSPDGPALAELLATMPERDALTERFRSIIAAPSAKASLKARARPLANGVYRRLRFAHLRTTGQHLELVNLQLARGFGGAKVQKLFALSECMNDVARLRSREGLDAPTVQALCRKADTDLLPLLARLAAGAPPALAEPLLDALEAHLRKPTRWSRTGAASAVRSELGGQPAVLERFASLLAQANKK